MATQENGSDSPRENLANAARGLAQACNNLKGAIVSSVPWKDVWCCKEPVEQALEQFREHRGAVLYLARPFQDPKWRDEFRSSIQFTERSVLRWLRAAEQEIECQRTLAAVAPEEFSTKQNSNCDELVTIAPRDPEVFEAVQEWLSAIAAESFGLAIKLDPAESETPRWDSDTRELWYGGTMIRRYSEQATMCFVALERFQEHHWPKRIANPLPYDSKIDPPSRLLSACKSLNKNLESIRFKVGDGGESLSWEKIENSP